MNIRRHKWAGALLMVSVGALGACSDDGGGSTSSSSSSGQGGNATSSTTATGTASSGGGGTQQCAGSASTANCIAYCTASVAAACANGPTTQQECEQQCEGLNDMVASCPQWGTVVDCAGSTPNIECFMDEPVPVGCEGEFYCLATECFGAN